VADAVPVHPHRRRISRKATRPDDSQHDAPGQAQAPALDPETTPGVVQRRLRQVLLLETRHPRPLPHRQPLPDVFVGSRPRSGEVADDLLLRHRRSHAQPFMLTTPAGQQLVQLSRTARLLLARIRLVVQVHRLGRGHALVPDPAAPIPLTQQRRAGDRRHAKPVGVPGMPGALPRYRCRAHDRAIYRGGTTILSVRCGRKPDRLNGNPAVPALLHRSPTPPRPEDRGIPGGIQ